MTSFRRIVMATPRFSGADGVSAVSRQYAAALQHAAAMDIWSLGDDARPEGLADGIAFRAAANSRLSLSAFALQPSAAGADTLILVMHVHLLPIVLPLAHAGARVVPVLHGVEAWKPLRRLERAAMKRAWRVIAVSEHTAQRFRAANPSLTDVPLYVCHSGVPPAAAPAESVSFPKPYALIVGRMATEERYKGHDALLDVWPRVVAAHPEAHLVMAGTGDDRQRLEQRVQAAALGERVILAGRVSDAELAALYRDATLFVMPSPNEGFGLVFLEAMRAGLPCIAARGAAEEIITDGNNGVIVDGHQPDALAGALIALFGDERLRARIGRAARERIAERFTAAHFAARLARVLDPAAVEVTC